MSVTMPSNECPYDDFYEISADGEVTIGTYENRQMAGWDDDEPLTNESVKMAARRLTTSRTGYRIVKRAVDIAMSLLVFALLWWVFVIVAIAIKVDSSGPVIFKQERVGRNGRHFTMYKFRSMYTDAEARKQALMKDNEKDGPVFKMRNDPRITRVGRFIRRVSIDELPQFANVLKGDLSVVGPRPALPSEVERYDETQRQRLLIKQGITCIWQTTPNRDSLSFDEWVDLDRRYIAICSPSTDLKIMVRTAAVMLTGQGE